MHDDVRPIKNLLSFNSLVEQLEQNLNLLIFLFPTVKNNIYHNCLKFPLIIKIYEKNNAFLLIQGINSIYELLTYAYV